MTSMPAPLAGLWPPPASIETLTGCTQLELTSYLAIDRRLGEIYRWVSRTLEDCLRIELEISYSEIPLGAGVALCYVTSIPDGGYRLVIDHQVTIEASSRRGIAFGLQTLRQVIGPSAFRAHGGWGEPSIMPNAIIVDGPARRDRTVVLDLTERPVPVSTLMRWLDMLAAYKTATVKLRWSAGTCTYSPDDLLEVSGFAGARCLWVEAELAGGGLDSAAQWTFHVPPDGCLADAEAALVAGARAFAATAWTGGTINPSIQASALAADNERCRAVHLELATAGGAGSVSVDEPTSGGGR